MQLSKISNGPPILQFKERIRDIYKGNATFFKSNLHQVTANERHDNNGTNNTIQ
jgi:hypothetical protein